jgi:protein ImuB
MPVAEALAVERRLHVQEADPEGDARSLERLAEWLERYSPVVGVEEGPDPQSLLIDITGCAAYFREEDRLLQRAAGELKGQRFSARLAMADTAGAAWGLARFAQTPCRAAPGKTEWALRPLPVAALRLPEETLRALAGLGVERVGQLMDLPRSDLPARFGGAVLRRLDQALGLLPEVIVPHRPAPEVFAVYPFEYATERLDELSRVIDRLAEDVHSLLQSRNRGARRVECRLYHETAAPRRLEAGLCRPSRSAEHLGMLIRAQLEQTRLAEPVVSVCLRVTEAEPLADTQADFFEAERQNEEKALAALIDRLSSRLGRGAVARAALVPDPQPEYACRFEPLVRTQAKDPKQSAAKTNPRRSTRRPAPGPEARWALPDRPLRLWSLPLEIEVVSVFPEGPPAQFRWAGREHRITRAWGPERIETGWWRGADVQRDYYVAATQVGARFWLFRRRADGRWFLHGCFE